MRRWDQATLAKRASMSAALVSHIETGRTSPSVEQVDSLATALGYAPTFLTATLELAPTTRPWLRAYADASKKEADARTAAATTTAEYIRLLNLKPLPDLVSSLAIHVDDDELIDELATEVRHLAELDEGTVVNDAIRAAERLGCIVLPLESELGRHEGMSVRADDLPIVCVAKENISGDRQRFTVAHEIGHLALHGRARPPRNADEASRMERQANRFAAAFLTPGEAVCETLHEAGGRVTLNALMDVKAVWGVSIKMLVGRFQSLGVIDADHARSLYKQISTRKWSKDEPVEVPLESAQWFARALTRKASTSDLELAVKPLAAAIGGRAQDLMDLADWSLGDDGGAAVIDFTERRLRRP